MLVGWECVRGGAAGSLLEGGWQDWCVAVADAGSGLLLLLLVWEWRVIAATLMVVSSCQEAISTTSPGLTCCVHCMHMHRGVRIILRMLVCEPVEITFVAFEIQALYVKMHSQARRHWLQGTDCCLLA